MESLLKVCAIALVGACAVSGLRKSLPEMSVAATLATLVALVFTAAGVIGTVIKFVYELAGSAGISDELIRPLIKTVGVSIVTKLACDVCRESGIISAASYIELVGGAVAISFSVPLMMSVLGQMA